jgi:radical SAM/Cys-rich protein
VDAQRGDGVFAKSVEALRRLNALGFGIGEKLRLDLVYNPGGAFLPGAQEKLERDYKEHLGREYGIRFHRLLTLANLPISRFAHWLERNRKTESYDVLLRTHFNPDTVPGLMCRHLISVDWHGRVYDCDFNQMLDIPLADGVPVFLWDLEPGALENRMVAVRNHCFGCTAGAGSSCGGALI